MQSEHVKKLVKIAHESVKDLDEPLKSEGFKTILSKLMEQNIETKRELKPRNLNTLSSDQVVEKVCATLNRTEHPEIDKMFKALDRALFILKISRDKVNVDGLLPLQISKILRMVFRLPTTPAAINMALGNARNFVDRKSITVQGGQGYRYFIMREGEIYLDKIIQSE